MLLLNQKDIRTILSPQEAINAIEEALLLFEKGEFVMPHRMHAQHHNNTLLLMPCFTNAFFGTKLISVNPENHKKGLPSLYGSMILNDGETGAPLALLNGAELTAIRTGAVGAVGIKHTTPNNLTAAGVIGTGIQGLSQAVFACKIRPIKQLFLFDKNPEKALQMSSQLKEALPLVEINTCISNQSLVEKSELIITATTSEQAVIPDEIALLKGKHFVGIGSYKPTMHEFPPQLFPLLEKVYVDTPLAIEESGDLSTPLQQGLLKEEQVIPLSQVIIKNKKITADTTLFKSVGMALFDVVIAQKIYQKAIKTQRGSKIIL